jgi:tetratricopeptide (TPR) repeat protein
MRRAAWRLFLFSVALASTAARSEVAPIEDAALNFVFFPPPAPWVQMRIEPGDRRRLLFADPTRRMSLTLVADDTGAPADVTDEEVLARALDRFGTKPGSGIVMLSSRERTIDGMPGMQLSHRRPTEKGIKYDVNWLGSRAGIVYWLSLSSDTQPVTQLVIDAQDLFERLALYDPDRSASTHAAATRFRSERFGYSLDLTGTGILEANRESWPKRVEFAGTLPGHDLAALTLLVIPVFLRDLPVDPDIADAALCAMVQPLVPTWNAARIADAEGARVREYEAMIPQFGHMVSYRARILQRGGYFIAVSVSVNGAGRDRTQTLLDATARLRLDSAPPHPPIPLNPAEGFRQTLFYNALGVAYTKAGRFAEAVSFFERADAPDSTDPTMAGNLANARLRAGRAREAALGVDQALKRFPLDRTLLGLRGLALFTLGDRKRAGEDLRLAYEGGNPSEDVVAAYVLVLTERQQFDAALSALDRYIQQRPEPGVRLLRSIVLQRAGRSEEATAAMLELLHEHPSDPTLLGALFGTAIENGDPAGFLVKTDSLVAQDRTGLVLYLRAFAQHALGRTDAAIAGLDQALKLTPDSQAFSALRERLVSTKQNASGRDT